MRILLDRWVSDADTTLGGLFIPRGTGRALEAMTLEDEHRAQKVWGETRIPAGTYPIHLRREGSFHTRYQERFGRLHRGMLWLQDVPGFEWIYLHIGNTDDDTAGCILVADLASWDMTVQRSEAAYLRVYPRLAEAAERGELSITIRDLDLERRDLELVA